MIKYLNRSAQFCYVRGLYGIRNYIDLTLVMMEKEEEAIAILQSLNRLEALLAA